MTSSHANKALLIIAICCYSFLIISCQNSNEEINNIISEVKTLKLDEAKEIQIYYSNDGVVKAVIKAKSFIRNGSSNPVYTDINNGLKVDFYNDSLQIESTLTGNSARLYENDNNVIIRGNVVVKNKKGETLETDELVWSQKIGKFYTDKKVKMFTPPNQIMYGDGLEANSDFTWHRINNLKGNIQVEGEGIPK